MTPREFSDQVDALCRVCRDFGNRGWCMATSGNFSARVGDGLCLITRSGRDKSRLSGEDLMLCKLDGTPLESDATPSAETPLHTMLYSLDDDVGAVLHTHSVDSTLLSIHCGEVLSVTGFEMQKALSGIESHESQVNVAVFDNDQDMERLAGKVASAWRDGKFRVPGFLIAGHGLYAWGENIAEARRHVEGFEFLFACVREQEIFRTP